MKSKSKSKSKSKIKTLKIKKNIDMEKKCLLNHCLPEYIEYQEEIPNNYKITSKQMKTKKNRKIIKSLERCSKKYCSK